MTTGMPWFYVIVAGSMLWRLVVTRLTIVSMRNASLLRLCASELRARPGGQDGGDATEEKDFRQDRHEYAGVHWASVGQAVMQLGVFFGVKKLVTLPVPQLQDSGFWLMPDLTVAGPYFIMPLMVAPLANLQLMVSVTMPDAQFD